DSTVIRGGFGMFYLLTQGIRSIGSGPINAPLQVDESLVVSTAVAPTNTIVDILPPFGQNFVQVGFSDFDPHQATPYVNEWNVAIQRQLFRSLAVEASYTGNSAHKLEYDQRLNVPAPGPGAIANRRPVPRFGAGGYLADIANSNYNSLKLRAEQRYSNRLTFLSTSVYGNALDNNPGSARDPGPTNLDP